MVKEGHDRETFVVPHHIDITKEIAVEAIYRCQQLCKAQELCLQWDFREYLISGKLIAM